MVLKYIAAAGLAATASAQMSCNDFDHGATEPYGAVGNNPTISSFILVALLSIIVMFSLGGFAMIEAGSTGVGGTTGVLVKVVANGFIGALAWWIFGYAWAFGEQHEGKPDEHRATTSTEWFIGNSGYFLQNVNPCNYGFWFFHFTLSALVIAILQSSGAGKGKLGAFLLITFWFSMWVYPTTVHWTWSSTAWLAQGSIDDSNKGIGYFDVGGSGVIHCTAGIAALVMAKMSGARAVTGSGHSQPLIALGFFIVFFGMLAKNAGLTAYYGRGDAVLTGVTMSLAVVNTALGAAGGALSALFVQFRADKWSLAKICNSALAGMVSVSAGLPVMYPWAGFVVGLIGGLVYKAWSALLAGAGIDDPADAVAVHFGAGAWGLIAVTLFAVDRESPLSALYGSGGIFYDAFDRQPWIRLGWNFFAIFMIALWVGFNTAVLVVALKKQGLDVEDDGSSYDAAYATDGAAAAAAAAPASKGDEQVQAELGVAPGAGSTEVKTSQI